MYAPLQHKPNAIQPKLEISQPGDEYEQEADAMADKVMRMPDAATSDEEEGMLQPKLQPGPYSKLQMVPLPSTQMVQRKCAECEEEKVQMAPAIQREGNGTTYASPQIAQQLQQTTGSGNELPGSVQQELGSKMGADFSGIKVHTDSQAVQMNQDLGAKAFTHGQNIYFNEGQYNPDSSEGKHLLAHELTHTVQQGGNQTIRKQDDEKTFKSSLFGGNMQLYYTLNRGTEYDQGKGHLIGMGSVGDYVTLLQTALNMIYQDKDDYEVLVPDRNFGELTLDAMSRFQKDYGLKQGTNGVVGPETLQRLDDEVLKIEKEEARGVETIGSFSEKVAADIIIRHGGARQIGTDLVSGEFTLTAEEDELLYTHDDSGTITGLTVFGQIVDDIIQDQSYLEKFNKDAADFFLYLASSEDITNNDLTALTDIRAEVVGRTKAEYMMAIFSPENVGTILFMSLGTGNGASNTLRQTGYKFLTTRLQQFAIAEAKAMTSLSTKGITGFTSHGVTRAAIQRGFSNQNILKIVNNGQVTKQVGKYGTYQLRYTAGGNTVVVETGINATTKQLTGTNAGKIITTFSDDVANGGVFKPF